MHAPSVRLKETGYLKVGPSGMTKAVLMTYLKSFIWHKIFDRSIRHTKNPCGEILLQERLDSNIYHQEVEKYVGEPGFIALTELDVRNIYHHERCNGPTV